MMARWVTVVDAAHHRRQSQSFLYHRERRRPIFAAVTENAIGASHLRKVHRRGTAFAPPDRFEEGM
jgi:hypothetical protein